MQLKLRVTTSCQNGHAFEQYVDKAVSSFVDKLSAMAPVMETAVRKTAVACPRCAGAVSATITRM